jgi:predicted permease
MALWITPLTAAMFHISPAIDLAPDFRLIAFITLVSVSAGVAAGLAPARFGARTDFAAVIKGGTPQSGWAPGARRLRSVFLGIQAAASVMLLVLTALFARALVQASRPDVDFAIDRLVTISAFASPSGAQVADDTFWDTALQRVRTLPGVESAAVVASPPLRSAPVPANVILDGRRYRVEQNQASPEYFGILRARFVAGRPYSRDEAAQKAPVAVITAGLARDFWPDGNALGSTLDRVHELYKGLLVIGIVGDVAPPPGRRPSAAGFGTIYRPVIEPNRVQMVVLLTSQGGQSLDTLRDAIAAIDANREPRLSLLQDELTRQLAGPRLMAGVAAILGGLALVLAVVGILGVTFVLVGQRRRELGLRMAIGATPWDVVRIVFRQGMWPVVIGVVVGIGLALMGTQLIGSYLVGAVSPSDPIAFGLAAAVLLTSAAVGALIPARRATRVDPVTVLREP